MDAGSTGFFGAARSCAPAPPSATAAIAAATPDAIKNGNRVRPDFLLGVRRMPVLLSSTIADAPDGRGAVVGNEERTVAGHRHSHRPAPHAAVRDAETGDEVLVLSGRSAVPDRHADHLVSGAPRAIP